MKVAIDVRSLMEGQVSGVGQYTQHIVRNLARVKPDNEYHLFYNSASGIALPELGQGVHVHGFRYPNKIFNALQWAASWPKWDIILPSIEVLLVPSLRLVPVSSHIPLVSVVHDLSFGHFPELFDVKRRVWHAMMRPKALAARSSAIIAVSEHTKQDIVNLYGIPEEKIHVVHSGVQFLESNQSISFSLPKKFILYLGTLEPRKNVDSLVRAYSAIADQVQPDLVIAGSPGWSMGEIEKAIKKSRVKERIHVIGFVPEEEKAALYQAADLFVYPSLYEGFGFPPLEALLAGTPVVTSFNSALPEVVGEWAMLIDPYDVGELALVLKELLNNIPEITPEIQQAVREKYSWDKAARQTLQVLESVV